MNTKRSSSVQTEPVLNQSRQALYRFGALAFLDPRAGSWEQLSNPATQQCVRAAAELIQDDLSLAATSPLGLGEYPRDMLDPTDMFGKLPDSAEELNAEFERTFGLVASGSCSPLETEYLDSKQTFKRSHHLADVAGFYNAFGLNRSPDHPERQDHLALELEFMACLINLERAAADVGENERVEICRRAQTKFLDEHLAWWVPTFARLLFKDCADGFYTAAGRFLCSFLPVERVLLGVEHPAQPAQPSRVERPEECEACPLHA